jgi:hypothetical protein
MHPRSNRGNTPPPSVEFQFVSVSRDAFPFSAFLSRRSARAKEDQRFKNG